MRPFHSLARLVPAAACLALLVAAAPAALTAPLPPARPVAAAAPQDTLVPLRGRVRDQVTGAGVAGMVVHAAGTDGWAVTDARGVFTLPGLRPGRYAIELRHPDYAPRSPHLEVGEGTAPVDLPVLRGPSGATPGTSAVVVEVVDENGSPVASAEVVATGAARGALTNADGLAWIGGIPAGADTVRVQVAGYEPARLPVALPDGRAAAAAVVLRRSAVRLERVVATGVAERRAPHLEGFEQRRARGRGTYLDSAAIQAKRPHRTSDIFRGVPGVELVAAGGGAYLPRFINSAPSFLADVDPRQKKPKRDCTILYYLDGVLQNNPGAGHSASLGAAGAMDGSVPTLVVDELVAPDRIAAVELYRSAATAPAQFVRPGADCGIIAIWTRR